jgi:protein-L-isoaspartate(D-aspartate) O-methyltransferase
MRMLSVGLDNFKEMRKAMVVSQLRTTDVSDPRVIGAMADVAREDFVPAANRSIAYSDRGVAIGEGRALNTPLATGLLINAANIRNDDRVLIVGAATGYSAAVVSRLSESVIALEQSAKLVSKAQTNLAAIEDISVEKGKLSDGFAKGAPYSVILIDGIVQQIPQALTDQLAEDGRLVAAISDSGISRLAIGRKAGSIVGYQYFADCGGCVLPGFEESKGFEF